MINKTVQNHLKGLELIGNLVLKKFADLEFLFGNTPKLLSELIRNRVIPKDNHRFIVSNFSAIEARFISWLAGETWRLELFTPHGKIYKTAAQ